MREREQRLFRHGVDGAAGSWPQPAGLPTAWAWLPVKGELPSLGGATACQS
jgi:hypothetical protein